MNIENISFESAMKELEEIVRKLEKGELQLDDAVNVYERGILLKKHCEKKLFEAKMRIETIQNVNQN